MRQLLCNSAGVLVARNPRPAVQPGTVLVRVRHSLVSAGTELAPLKATLGGDGSASAAERVTSNVALAKTYLGKAIRNPRLAARRLAGMAKRRIRRTIESSWPQRPRVISAPVAAEAIGWERCEATSFEAAENGGCRLTTDTSAASYQARTSTVPVGEATTAVLTLKGTVSGDRLSIGLLSGDGSRWLGAREYEPGAIDDELIVAVDGVESIQAVVANCGTGTACELDLESSELTLQVETAGLPLSELDDQGWNLGYSAAGEVVAVGEGVNDVSIGDFVACAGAGLANHADFVAVPRNLVCPLPAGCDTRSAATTTVGTIALQGVRRSEPQFGETIAVIGLGLIGQITGQLLRASGCTVIGLDLDPKRVERARGSAVDDGASDAGEFAKLVRDRTGGYGADRTIVTAAAKTNAVINGAMQCTRRKGRVVIVGDVGLGLERAEFYKKEIDLLMSTSYGPGRYDATYEAEGKDYPFAYVRWTINRNMQAYLEAIAAGRIDVERLIDRTIPIEEAPDSYREMATSKDAPLGVLIEYPEQTAAAAGESPDSPRIRIRGHRRTPTDRVNYALVGAGAFGTCMLVPMMEKRKDAFFLRGVVSRNAVQGGNYARTQRVEVFASELDAILDDPDFHLIVIATRHHEHASQVIRGLRAGKHVFVEKPLALTWDELESVTRAHAEAPEGTSLMVGFNRRFSPALDTVREIVANRRSPIVVNYRVNAGYIPGDSWVHGPQGGGRNIGEACHMYDVFRSLANAPARDVSATSIGPGANPLNRNDNFAATVSYEDGSVGNLVYTALGPKGGLGKERIEIFVDGEAYVVDDFRELVRASDQKVLWSSAEADKGHREEMSLLADSLLAGTASPIPFDEIVESSAVALEVEDILHGRALIHADAS